MFRFFVQTIPQLPNLFDMSAKKSTIIKVLRLSESAS